MKVYRVEFSKTVLVMAEDSTAAVALAEANEEKARDSGIMAECIHSASGIYADEAGLLVVHAGSDDITVAEALARAAAT